MGNAAIWPFAHLSAGADGVMRREENLIADCG